MDKLKIVKALVFLLTFILVFLLCFVVSKALTKGLKSQDIDIKIADTEIREIAASGDYLYVLGSEQVHIINIKNHNLLGGVSLLKEGSDGIKEKEER